MYGDPQSGTTNPLLARLGRGGSVTRKTDRLNPRARKYALARLRQVAQGDFGDLSEIASQGLGSSDPTLRWRQLSAALMAKNPNALSPGAEHDPRSALMGLGADVQDQVLARQRAESMAPLMALQRQITSPPGPEPLQALKAMAARLPRRAVTGLGRRRRGRMVE